MNEYKKINSHLTACSANYFRLKKILSSYQKNQIILRNSLNKNMYNARFLLTELSKHSSVCDFTFSNLDSKLLNSFQFELNIYHDVELCEVNSLMGIRQAGFLFNSKSFQNHSMKNHNKIDF